MTALSIVLFLVVALVLCLFYALWTLDHNPHGGAPPPEDWKEGLDD